MITDKKAVSFEKDCFFIGYLSSSYITAFEKFRFYINNSTEKISSQCEPAQNGQFQMNRVQLWQWGVFGQHNR